ncbi:MAG: hypothetical protein JST01_15335 [Cyanobacteria bacterium SZAS TMP-1]|nr:hypothetical protein [Cyanobacteria bacterium SZAS TMP-1]
MQDRKQENPEKFDFDRVAFFGRGIDEYVAMFNLDLQAMLQVVPLPRVLDCPAGPAAFAAQGAGYGLEIVACDPMYGEDDVNHLRWIIDLDAHKVAVKQAANRSLFHSQLTPVAVRRRAMDVFLDDYVSGRSRGRYVAGQLPYLPFEDKSFDIVLSANLLFIYSDFASGGMMENSPFDFDFHKRAIYDLLRVARREIRIYPLNGPMSDASDGKRHAYLGPLMDDLTALGHRVQLQRVKQRDIVGAEDMLLIEVRQN